MPRRSARIRTTRRVLLRTAARPEGGEEVTGTAAAPPEGGGAPPEPRKRERRLIETDLVMTRLQLGAVVPPLDGTKHKAGVVTALCPPSVKPKFTLLSGVHAWRNGVVLFINVDQSTYENVFDLRRDGGCSVTWFAAKSSTEETPVVQRLMAPDTQVLLFCREPGQSYVYCGLLRYLRHVPGQRPLQMQFELLEAFELLAEAAFWDVLGNAVRATEV